MAGKTYFPIAKPKGKQVDPQKKPLYASCSCNEKLAPSITENFNT